MFLEGILHVVVILIFDVGHLILNNFVYYQFRVATRGVLGFHTGPELAGT